MSCIVSLSSGDEPCRFDVIPVVVDEAKVAKFLEREQAVAVFRQCRLRSGFVVIHVIDDVPCGV